MILEHGDMWDIFGKTDLFVITTNNVIKNDGRLVMGAGIAKQARDRIADIDLIAGRKVSLIVQYGCLYVGEFGNQHVAIFQVKRHFKDKATIHLIEISTMDLFSYLINKPTIRVDMNFPGIGYGGLSEDEVLPIISLLPNNVHVWKYRKD